MTTKQRVWSLLALAGAICGISVGAVIWFHGQALSTQEMLKRLPTRDTLLLSVDFAALRRGGVLKMLEGAKASEEPEYQAFVRRTKFDYRRDLDSALVAFAPAGNYLFVKGRFDWKTLRTYADSEGGSCSQSFCKMPGSAPGRNISFLPLPGDLMALAVSADPTAVQSMAAPAGGPDVPAPNAPVWLSIPSSLLRSRQGLPAGTGLFASAMEGAQAVTLTFVPEAERFAAKLEVRCYTEREAADVAGQLTHATDLLHQLILREHHTPNPADLSGVLSSGSFKTDGQRVLGYWPIEPSFVRTVLAGELN